MRKRLYLAAASFCLATVVFADNQAGQFTISPMVGYFDFSNAFNVKNSALPSVSFGYNFTDNWGTELLIGGVDSDRTDVNQRARVGISGLDGVYFFNSTNGFQPYLLAGVGLTYMRPNGTISPTNLNGDDEYTQTALNGGGGVEYSLDQYAALRADLRDFYQMNGSHNSFMASVGMTFFIGGEESATPYSKS
jgi:OOP family OmpA-OmpF porin